MPTDTDHDRITRIEVMVTELHKRLLGNGQPGEIAKLETRIGALEKWRWMLGGALVLMGGLIGWAVEAWAR